ncbi:uncharacterized protein N7482_003156 [Penicillium canariense]|uniref:Uncharacterized protein n=1 Tax=Penicillium canariense TaxID=189055 RepID=A0A9W9IGU4_9EURO|nr:uncharacterized protein N7482_003156 [Penicillium canariense]KAJ5177279.1 hypothetical protein N7482_003156 [Penicillium canariense]
MQRAAASAAAKESRSPAAEDDQRTPKRPRLSTEAGSPATPQSDLEAISAALAAEEAKRREAVARQAAEAGESEWVLDIPAADYAPQPIVLAADSLDAEDDLPQGGRRAYGNFKRSKPSVSSFLHMSLFDHRLIFPQAPTHPDADQDDDDDDEEEEELTAKDAANPQAVEAWLERVRQKGLAKEARRKAAMAKQDKVRLSGLTSISGSRPAASPKNNSQSSKKKKKRKD